MQSPHVRTRDQLSFWWSCSNPSKFAVGAKVFGCSLSRVRGSAHVAIAWRNFSVACVIRNAKALPPWLRRGGPNESLVAVATPD
jgi:hypothetical protein